MEPAARASWSWRAQQRVVGLEFKERVSGDRQP